MSPTLGLSLQLQRKVLVLSQESFFKKMFALDGKCALITGASSGLGAHFARTLAAAGARVVLAARRVERLEALASEITDAGGQAYAVAMDVTDPESVKAAFADFADNFAPADILINNAGVSTVKPFIEHTEEDWDFVVGTNLRGAWRVAQEGARQMAERGEGGVIINIASLAGITTGGQFAAYSTAKAGLIHLTRNLALELARHDIRVNALAPGYFSTEMNDAFLESEMGQKLRKSIPTRRFGELEDLDAPLLTLCGSGGRHITGVVLPVDGGHLVKGI